MKLEVTKMDIEYKRENVYLAMLLFVFKPSKYQSLAANHNIATTLEAPELAQKYREGNYPINMYEYLSHALEMGIKLKQYLLRSFFTVSKILIVALAIGCFTNKLSFSLPLSINKITSISSAFLLSWAALFELGWDLRTWKGEAMHERVHSLLFKTMFVSGSLLLMIALLM